MAVLLFAMAAAAKVAIATPSCHAEIVTMIQLLADPAQYDKQCVKVSGILATAFEENALYLGWEFARDIRMEYSLPVEYTKAQLGPGPVPGTKRTLHLVRIEAVFSAFPKGALFAGQLISVQRVVY